MQQLVDIAPVSKYSSYKYSGEDWMGDVPEHWEVIKLKHVLFEKKKRTNPALNAGSISFGKVVVKDDEKIPFATKASYQEVRKGEFLVNPLNLNYDLISLRIALSSIDVVVSSGYIVLDTKTDVNKVYLNYLLHRYDVAYMKLLGSGVRQTINFNDIADSLLILPPKQEQTRIAQFLDRKTAQIDQAVAQKERLIELLKERRQILIHNAVTRGLDPNVKMKDSGVEWIGEVPEHWRVAKIGHYAVVTNGTTPSRNNERFWKNGNVPWLPSGKVNEFIINEASDFVTESALRECSLKLFPAGTVLIGIVGQGKTRGTSALLNINATINQNLAGIIPNKEINPRYLHYFLLTSYDQIRNYGQGANQEALNCHLVSAFKMIIPPLEEQIQIVHFIESLSNKTNYACLSETQQIEKLKEYKATLINSAVTGKIKV